MAGISAKRYDLPSLIDSSGDWRSPRGEQSNVGGPTTPVAVSPVTPVADSPVTPLAEPMRASSTTYGFIPHCITRLAQGVWNAILYILRLFNLVDKEEAATSPIEQVGSSVSVERPLTPPGVQFKIEKGVELQGDYSDPPQEATPMLSCYSFPEREFPASAELSQPASNTGFPAKLSEDYLDWQLSQVVKSKGWTYDKVQVTYLSDELGYELAAKGKDDSSGKTGESISGNFHDLVDNKVDKRLGVRVGHRFRETKGGSYIKLRTFVSVKPQEGCSNKYSIHLGLRTTTPRQTLVDGKEHMLSSSLGDLTLSFSESRKVKFSILLQEQPQIEGFDEKKLKESVLRPNFTKAVQEANFGDWTPPTKSQILRGAIDDTAVLQETQEVLRLFFTKTEAQLG